MLHVAHAGVRLFFWPRRPDAARTAGFKFGYFLPIHGQGILSRNLCNFKLSNSCLAGMYVYEMSGKIPTS